MKDQIAKLTLQVQNLERKKSTMHSAGRTDFLHLRLAFIGFKHEDLERRSNIMKAFMATNFPSEQFAAVDTAMSGPRGDRKPSTMSFVQFHTENARDRVAGQVQARGLEVKNDKGDKVKDDRARSDVQRAHNWAMRKAEEMLEEALPGSTVQFHAGKGMRKLTVGNTDYFCSRTASAATSSAASPICSSHREGVGGP